MPPVDDIQIGDLVNVPGGMYGTVKYLGPVAGKPGRFAGVELAGEHAERGKNSGDVDGKRYFATSVPGSGIFVPINNNRYITKRVGTPPTPTPTRSATVNFSKSVGPGATVPRPQFRRPSLPRDGSPHTTTTSRPKPGFGSLRTPSVGTRPGASPTTLSRPRSPMKTPSRLATPRPPSRVSTESETPTSLRISDPSSMLSAPGEVRDLRERVKALETQLRDRDKQLNEQASTLAEFQRTMEELEGSDALSIRAQLREKNEKIAQLTSEFDNHRADFRSTLDTLEVAASETERVYEQRIEELMQQNKELMDHGEDVELVAGQLKQLEELVSELEEGLEDARRGEAEARAENEFLRGEVERTKLELEKERGDSAAALKDADGHRHARELEQKDDEIRGLKAIIHSLSRGDTNVTALLQNGNHDAERIAELEHRVQEFEHVTETKSHRIEELERELQLLQLSSNGQHSRSSTVTVSPSNQHASTNSTGYVESMGVGHSHKLSDRTVVPNSQEDFTPSDSSRYRGDSFSRAEPVHVSAGSDDGSALWCEICETNGHDILNCTNMFGPGAGRNGNGNSLRPVQGPHDENSLSRSHSPLSDQTPPGSTQPNGFDHLGIGSTPRKTGRDAAIGGLRGIGGLLNSMAPVAGKASGVIDESKWCALCERDGHESIDCPFDE